MASRGEPPISPPPAPPSPPPLPSNPLPLAYLDEFCPPPPQRASTPCKPEPCCWTTSTSSPLPSFPLDPPTPPQQNSLPLFLPLPSPLPRPSRSSPLAGKRNTLLDRSLSPSPPSPPTPPPPTTTSSATPLALFHPPFSSHRPPSSSSKEFTPQQASARNTLLDMSLHRSPLLPFLSFLLPSSRRHLFRDVPSLFEV